MIVRLLLTCWIIICSAGLIFCLWRYWLIMMNSMTLIYLVSSDKYWRLMQLFIIVLFHWNVYLKNLYYFKRYMSNCRRCRKHFFLRVHSCTSSSMYSSKTPPSKNTFCDTYFKQQIWGSLFAGKELFSVIFWAKPTLAC